MKAVWLLLTVCVTVASAMRRNSTGIILNLETDEICLEGDQCTSGCCKKHGTLGIHRCAPVSLDNQPCQQDGLWDVYDECPCDLGLSCRFMNSNIGICYDPNDPDETG
uniref:colipase-like n=1 Tax=Myxine glutinosa TaxID=7769 RepID=UPI00358FFBBF